MAAFADIAALFDIAQRLDLVQLLDSILPAKRRQGLSVGQYLLLAAINRAVSPTSKLQFADWYRQAELLGGFDGSHVGGGVRIADGTRAALAVV